MQGLEERENLRRPFFGLVNSGLTCDSIISPSFFTRLEPQDEQNFDFKGFSSPQLLQYIDYLPHQ